MLKLNIPGPILMYVGKILFQVQHGAPPVSGPGHSVALSNAAQLRNLLHESRTEHCHFLIAVTVRCERCGADSRLEQRRWTCEVLEGLSVHMGMGRVGKEAKIHQQNSLDNCDSARIGLGYNGQNKWKTTRVSCLLSFLKERLSLASALVSLGRY